MLAAADLILQAEWPSPLSIAPSKIVRLTGGKYGPWSRLTSRRSKWQGDGMVRAIRDLHLHLVPQFCPLRFSLCLSPEY